MTRLLWAMLALAACAAPVMAQDSEEFVTDAPSQELAPPPPDKAQIVFLEAINRVQGYFPTGIWLLEGEKQTLIATTIWESRTQVLLDPGQHRLMSNSFLSLCHFLDVDVEAGKRYYVLVRFSYGDGMQLRPIRTTAVSDFNMVGADWKEWIAKTQRLVVKTAVADEAFYRPKIVKRREKFYAKSIEAWNKKTEAQKAELKLTREDAAPL